jgi:hypothetical protein
MSKQRYIKSNIKYRLLVSFLGLFLIAMLTYFPPATTGSIFWRKPLIGLIFSSICVLGILAVLSPSKCLRIIGIGKKNTTVGSDSTKLAPNETSYALQGHHPTCGNFSAHIFRIKGKTYCAACVGLLFGGLLALASAAVYFFSDWQVAEHSSLMVLLGLAGVSVGLFQIKFKNTIRLFVNTIFVLGNLSILIGIDALIHSLFIDLFVVSLIIFWLFTRISLSQWNNERICSDCEIENCKNRV